MLCSARLCCNSAQLHNAFMDQKNLQLVANDLRRSFRIGSRRIEVLRGISLEVAHGEAVFLCGASGAGKTTLLYTLAGLERPESGTVEFEGRRLYTGSRIVAGQTCATRRWVLFFRVIFCSRN